MKISPHVAMLNVEYPGGQLHPALLWDENTLMLVDAGFPGQLDALCDAIRKEGFAPEALTHILFTHGDIDHVGCARELMALAPGAETMAHRLEAGHIDGSDLPPKVAYRRALYQNEPEKLAEIEAGAANYAAQCTVPIARKLEDGDVMRMCGGIRVIHAPGHTDGHCFFYLESGRVLITGDGINAQMARLSGPNPIHTFDMEKARASITRLATMKLPIDEVISYHGGRVIGDIQSQLEGLAGHP